MPKIRSAIKQGQRPTAILLCEPDPFSGWKKMDYLLQEAYHTMEQEICTICNNPIWLCHSTDNRIDFKVSVRTCFAKAELEDFEKTSRGKKMDAGEYLAARAVGIDDGMGNFDPIPARNEAYKRMPED